MHSETKMVFDTNCILCSGFVQFILKHEKNRNIVFINAWSETGLAISKEYGLDEAALHQTYLVVFEGKGLIKSNAGLAILSHLKSPWSWLRALRFVPRPIRDGVYTIVANHRYQWFGYSEQCFLPPETEKHRFIDS